MANVITREDHKYKHFNNSMGINIESKRHYDHEMKKRGLIPKDQADDIVKSVKEREHKTPVLSRDAKELINSITHGRSTWKPGERIQLSGKQIDGMKKCGMSFEDTFSFNKTKGGWK